VSTVYSSLVLLLVPVAVNALSYLTAI